MDQLPLPGMEDQIDELTEDQVWEANVRKLFADDGPGQAWLDEYWSLRGEGFTWRQAIYLLWMAQPHGRRVPRTQGELATTVLGLASDQAIRRWRNDHPEIERRIAMLQASALEKRRAAIIAALAESAENPNPRNHADRRMALEMTGDYVPKTTVTANVGDLSGLSEEDLAALAGPMGGKGKDA